MQKYEKFAIETIGCLDFAETRMKEADNMVSFPAQYWRIVRREIDRMKRTLSPRQESALKNEFGRHAKMYADEVAAMERDRLAEKAE